MRVDLGIFAHNEAAGIANMVAAFRAQDATGLDLRILVLANGCSDDTARRAGAAGAEVADLAEGGKSRTWNRFVHDLSRRDADVLVFADADIELPEPDMLLRLVTTLSARPELHVVNSQPVKDTAVHRDGLTLTDRIIAMAGGTLDDWRTAICGQLYAMPAHRARARRMPVGLPVEDGFLRAMVLTDDLTMAEDFSRIDGTDVWHIYGSERSVTALIRHQIRIVIGSAVNMAAFGAIRSTGPADRHAMWETATAGPGWLQQILHSTLPCWPYGYIPLHFLTKRSGNLLSDRARLWRPKGLFLLIAGFCFDLVVYILAQIRMFRGTGVGYW